MSELMYLRTLSTKLSFHLGKVVLFSCLGLVDFASSIIHYLVYTNSSVEYTLVKVQRRSLMDT